MGFNIFRINKNMKVNLHLYLAPRSKYFTQTQLYCGYMMDLPALKLLQILICKIAQAQTDWMDGVCENQFSSLPLDSSLDFDWAILAH